MVAVAMIGAGIVLSFVAAALGAGNMLSFDFDKMFKNHVGVMILAAFAGMLVSCGLLVGAVQLIQLLLAR